MADTLFTLSIISFVIAAISLTVAIFFFFFFRIPSVIGDLSGKTARKSIAKMRQANYNSGNKTFKSSSANLERGKITQKVQTNRQAPVINNTAPVIRVNDDTPETGILDENKSPYYETQATTILNNDFAEDATGLLTNSSPHPQMYVSKTGAKQLNIIKEIMLIHTDEEIL